MLIIRMHNLENLYRIRVNWELTVFFVVVWKPVASSWGSGGVYHLYPAHSRLVLLITNYPSVENVLNCIEGNHSTRDWRLESTRSWFGTLLLHLFLFFWFGLCSGLVWGWGLVRRVSCCMHFFYGSETKAERVKLQLGCPLLLLLLLLLPKRTSAKSYRAVSKKKKKNARIVFICSPVAAVDVAVAVSVDVLVVAATETNRLTVPASGLATHTQTHTHTGTHRQRQQKLKALWVAA